jgi:hypothetical protein
MTTISDIIQLSLASGRINESHSDDYILADQHPTCHTVCLVAIEKLQKLFSRFSRKNQTPIILSKKKIKGYHDADIANHGRSVQRLATDFAKPPPVDPVAPSSDVDVSGKVLDHQRCNQTPTPKVLKERNAHCIQVLLLASEPVRLNHFPSPLPLRTAEVPSGFMVRNWQELKRRNTGQQVHTLE